MDTIYIAMGALILSIVHAVMPDHWIPLVLISRTEKWSRTETTWITAVIALPHIISTISIGLIIGIIGYSVSSTSEVIMHVAVPLILVGLGLVYVAWDVKGNHKHSHLSDLKSDPLSKKTKFTIIFSLATALFFSPCMAIGSYYLLAGITGWVTIVVVSTIYLIVTLGGMILMVNLGLKGVKKIESEFLAHHERLVTGLILIILAVVLYFVEI